MINNIPCLYIHIPFCDHICSYCDFYKRIAKEEVINKYVLYLEKELILKSQDGLLKNINTIYIGGGTPSCIGLNNLNILFSILKKYIDFNNINEFSIECNPKDISNELIKLFKDNKVNRISLGVQSFNNKKLKLLNRNHDKKIILNSLQLLKQNDFSNVNIDIMYGLPNDNIRLLKQDFKYLKKYNIKHVSCYSLILEPRTILYNKYKQGNFKLFNEDKEAKLYYQIQSILFKLGYNQYEISNYCLKGYECFYNLNTWNNNNYLGIGTSASYYINNKRYTNIKNLNSYFESLDQNKMLYFEEEVETKESKMYEEIMLGLRKICGINIINFNNKYNCDILNEYPNINFLIKNDLLKLDENNNLFIPFNKLYISNTIINKILS